MSNGVFRIIYTLLTITITLSAGFGTGGGFSLAGGGEFLKPSEAFRVSAKMHRDAIDVNVSLGEKIHIYADKLKFRIVSPENIPLEADGPEPVEYGGEKVYYGDNIFHIPKREYEKVADGPVGLEVSLSGCSDAGICYQPQKYRFELSTSGSDTTLRDRTVDSGNGVSDGSLDREGDRNEESFLSRIGRLSSDGNSAGIAKALADEGILFILILFFVAGLLLSLTPCILPMIPILSSIIIREAGRREGGVSRSESFIISLVYVVSMSFAYAMIGVVAGLLGFDLQAHMNNPWIIVPMAMLFVALAMSLFGYFDLALPASWQSRLSGVSDGAKGKGLLGTAVMGALSALIVGTCTAPVISGAIIFISMTGDAVLGGVSLFVMGMGAGMPLLLVGMGADRLVPRPGGWMTRVSQIFGVAMLAMALYVLRGILSDSLYMMLFSLLAIGSAIYMGVFDDRDKRVGAYRLIQLFAFVLLLYGTALFFGALGGAGSVLDPMSVYRAGDHSVEQYESGISVPKERRVGYDLKRLQKEIASAHKPVVVDIGKQNCAACDELERITFKDPRVVKEMKRFRFIQIDITENSEGDREILEKYGLFGAPNILFFDSNGKALEDRFLTGFIPPEKFVSYLKSVK